MVRYILHWVSANRFIWSLSLIVFTPLLFALEIVSLKAYVFQLLPASTVCAKGKKRKYNFKKLPQGSGICFLFLRHFSYTHVKGKKRQNALHEEKKKPPLALKCLQKVFTTWYIDGISLGRLSKEVRLGILYEIEASV